MSEPMTGRQTKYHPTLIELYEWWLNCEEHLEICRDEECEWYWAFAHFLKTHGLQEEGER